MDDALKATYEKLKGYRTDTDLSIRASPFLKKTFTGFDGTEHPLTHRYYQVQGILHLFAMNRFLLGDDCGLGNPRTAWETFDICREALSRCTT